MHFACDKNIEVHISEMIVFDGKLYKLNSNIPFSGKVYSTYPDSSKQYEGIYKNGKPNGLLIYWHNNGNKMREGNLKNGSPIGRWKYYNENGKIENIIDNGKQITF